MLKETKKFRDAICASSYVYLIGVAGDSGSGKTTFSRAIREIFGDELVCTITTDDYHLYDRETRNNLGITPLVLSANDLEKLRENLSNLKRGKGVTKPVYNHEHGTHGDPEYIFPKKFVVVEGLHPYATEELRSLYDYTIFVDPDKEVKYDWKTKRDVSGRNYNSEDVIKEISQREPDYEKYVLPQRKSADAVIQIGYSGYGKQKGETDNVYRVLLSMEYQDYCFEDIELNIDLCDLFKNTSLDFSLFCISHTIDNRIMRAMGVDGELMPDTIHKIERQIEKQTRVEPINIFHGQDRITGTDIIRLILSWQIINSRIHISKENLSGQIICRK
jgi:phosphoribulokinase